MDIGFLVQEKLARYAGNFLREISRKKLLKRRFLKIENSSNGLSSLNIPPGFLDLLDFEIQFKKSQRDWGFEILKLAAP
jgi:hypothetical protein